MDDPAWRDLPPLKGASMKFSDIPVGSPFAPKWEIGPDGQKTPYAKRPAPKPRARFWPASDLHGKTVPDRAWLVPDLVPSRTVTLLGGDGGTGKSLLALQLAAAVASGLPWVGRTVATGSALYLSAEDDEDELHRRLADIARAAGISLQDLDRLTVTSLAGEDALLASLDARSGAMMPTPLFGEVERQIAAMKPAVVMLDTLADLYPGDENNRAQARHFVGMIRGLCIRHDCAVVVLSHPSLSGMSSGTGTSGSTAWNNSVRSRLYFSRVAEDGYEADTDARVLTTKKANYGPTGAEIAMRWNAGVFLADAAATGLDRMAASAKAERVFLKLLRQFGEQGRRVNPSAGPHYAPKVFSEHPDAEGCNKRAFKAAMERLLKSGALIIAQVGPPSRRVTCLAERGQ